MAFQYCRANKFRLMKSSKIIKSGDPRHLSGVVSMRRPLFTPISVFALAALSGGAMFAQSMFDQSFAGTWQGALKLPQAPNSEIRIVLKISRTTNDKLAGQFYSIDQSGPAVPTTTLTASGPAIKMTLERINASYEGRMTPDGKTISGTFNQGAPLPLEFTRATPETAWTIPEPPAPPKAMDPKADPSFDVATIKPSDPNRPGWGLGRDREGVFRTQSTTVADLARYAFTAHLKQLIGLPAWAETEKFDVLGKPDTPGFSSTEQMRTMVRKLLVERFSLAYHREKKQIPVYALTVAKAGPKVKQETEALSGPAFGGAPQRGFQGRSATMAEFASIMQSQFMDLPVVDQTALGDTRYTFTLKFTPDSTMRPFGGTLDAQAPPLSADDAPPDLFSALEQQLGLRLQKTKASVDVIVIDKIEKPSAN
jgi:uncharacterized protein (TIGR03435 family)